KILKAGVIPPIYHHIIITYHATCLNLSGKLLFYFEAADLRLPDANWRLLNATVANASML
ncbi:MAG: hypothetical protein K2G64_07260, partial [Muribaculaceae bacterium]|nr:hypothetical protein [Muribaculaceae bacterium]